MRLFEGRDKRTEENYGGERDCFDFFQKSRDDRIGKGKVNLR
jgi:hypothetical protein